MGAVAIQQITIELISWVVFFVDVYKLRCSNSCRERLLWELTPAEFNSL